jgi:hypothetical protein
MKLWVLMYAYEDLRNGGHCASGYLFDSKEAAERQTHQLDNELSGRSGSDSDSGSSSDSDSESEKFPSFQVKRRYYYYITEQELKEPASGSPRSNGMLLELPTINM